MRQSGGFVGAVVSGVSAPGFRRKAKLAGLYVLLVVFSVFVGLQIHSPHPRVVKLTLAFVLFYMTIKSALPNVVAVLAFILPFSASTALGPTSSLAIVLVFLVWMVRVATRSSTVTWRTPVSRPLMALLLIHVVSFYNIPGGPILDAALKKTVVLVSGMLLVYLMLNFITDEKALRRVLIASMLTCLVVIVLSLIELYFPRLRLIPWFTLSGTKPMKGYFETRWIGGPFRDGELLGEYMAVSVPVQAFLFGRARSQYVRAFWGLMMIGSLATALATMHRAPLITMTVGVLYLIFLFRERMKFHTLLGLLVGGTILVASLEYFMANYTPTGSVIKRIEKTEFYGIVPDSRRMPWKQAWERSMEHPWIGHGPHYDISYTVQKMYSPHSSYLYYFYTIGAIGVVIFLWYLVTLLRMTVRYMSPRTHVHSFSTDLLAVLHVQLVAFMADAIKINFQRNNMYFLLVWLMFGMCVACYKVARRTTMLELSGRGVVGGSAA